MFLFCWWFFGLFFKSVCNDARLGVQSQARDSFEKVFSVHFLVWWS